MIYLIKNETPDTKNLVTKTNFDKLPNITITDLNKKHYFNTTMNYLMSLILKNKQIKIKNKIDDLNYLLRKNFLSHDRFQNYLTFHSLLQTLYSPNHDNS